MTKAVRPAHAVLGVASGGEDEIGFNVDVHAGTSTATLPPFKASTRPDS